MLQNRDCWIDRSDKYTTSLKASNACEYNLTWHNTVTSQNGSTVSIEDLTGLCAPNNDIIDSSFFFFFRRYIRHLSVIIRTGARSACTYIQIYMAAQGENEKAEEVESLSCMGITYPIGTSGMPQTV